MITPLFETGKAVRDSINPLNFTRSSGTKAPNEVGKRQPTAIDKCLRVTCVGEKVEKVYEYERRPLPQGLNRRLCLLCCACVLSREWCRVFGRPESIFLSFVTCDFALWVEASLQTFCVAMGYQETHNTESGKTHIYFECKLELGFLLLRGESIVLDKLPQ